MARGIGRHVFGAGALILGLVGLWWRQFATVWQPVPDDITGRALLACAAAAVLVVTGAAMQGRRGRAIAGLAASALSAVFAALWVRRIVGFPGLLAVWLGCAEETALVIGGLLVYLEGRSDRRSARARRVLVVAFGSCALLFGASHLVYVAETAAMVPSWILGGARFWAVVTGVFHIAAGLAVIIRVADLLAARLLAAMFAVFGALVWLPILVQSPTDHTAWAGNGLNLALVGAAWLVSETVARTRDDSAPAVVAAAVSG
jgi:uncharacterized membrane protein